jgi:C1q domain
MRANINVRQIILKHGNSTVASNYVGPIGEVVLDTDLQTIRVQDGTTLGGIIVPTQANAQSYVNLAIANSGFGNTLANIQSGISTITGFDANTIAEINTLIGNLSNQGNIIANIQSSITGNVITNANLSLLNPGDMYFTQTANTVSMGQFAAQNVTLGPSGIQIAGTGGVQIMGAAGAAVDLGGTGSGSIVFNSPTIGINYNDLTNKPTPYGNSNVASYLSGNITVGNLTVVGGNLNLGNGRFGDPFGDGALNLVGTAGLYGELISNDLSSVIWVADSTYSNPSGGGVGIATGVSNGFSSTQWTFSGNIFTFPDFTQQTTAYQGPSGQTSFATASYVNTANSYNQTFTTTAINNLINSAPSTLNTLGKIASNLASETKSINNIISNIAGINANVSAANVAIATLQTQLYGNANVASYLTQYGGNVALGYITNNGYSWAFESNGSLSLTQGSVIGETTSPSGVGTAVAITPANGTDPSQQLLIYPTIIEGNHIHLTTGALYTTSLFLGDDFQYVRTNTDGTITIGTSDGNPDQPNNGQRWTFNASGAIVFPDQSIQSTAYTGPTYGDANVAAYLATQTTGNVGAGNLTVINNFTTDVITANTFTYANGVSILSGINPYGNTNVAAYLATQTFYSNSNVASYLVANPQSGTYSNANVITLLSAYGSNTISTTGSITTGNLITPKIYGGASTVIYNTISNVYVQALAITAAGIGTYGNINPGGNIVMAAGKYIVSTNGSNANINLDPDGSGIVNIIGNAVVTSNVQAAYFVGNGSALTGITANSYNNIYGTTSNVTLVAGSYSYVFDNTGNITLPVNGDLVFSNNTSLTSLSNGNITIDPNGTGQLVVTSTTPAAFGNTITAAGTVTSYGTTNSTAFAVVGNGAQSNVALGFFPSGSTAAMMAIRDYSTANSAMYFDTTIGSANVGGNFQFRGSNSYTQYAQIDRYGINLPTRPAFRVYGSGTTNNLTTSTNTTGVLNSNNWAVDYQQGSALNGTTGVFTAPVAGLYHVTLSARTNSNSLNDFTQFICYKNSTTSVICIEWSNNTSYNHGGSGTIVKLAVGDTLKIQVTHGSINFDGNDNWCVAYIG